MIPFHYMDLSGGWWFLPTIGFFIFMMLACFLFRRVFHGGALCCAGRVGGKNAAPDDPVGILRSRYAKGEIGCGEYERIRRENREDDRGLEVIDLHSQVVCRYGKGEPVEGSAGSPFHQAES